MRQIYPGVYAPSMTAQPPAPSSRALRYVNSYTDARFEAWERSREEAELGLKADLSAYDAQREALRLTIETATKQAQAAREAAQDYREGGLKTLEGAAEFQANAANRQELFNISEINDSSQFVAGEKNDAAMFSVGERNKAARGAAARAGSAGQPPKGLDEKAVESLIDGVAFTSTAGQSPYATVKGAFDTADAQANKGALTRDRQPYTPEQQTYIDAQAVSRQVRGGQVSVQDLRGILDDPNTDAYTADRLERALAYVSTPSAGKAGSPGSSAGGGGVGAQGYSPEGAQLQGMNVDPILQERERLAALRDQEAADAERRLLEAQAALAALGYPEVDLLARQRQSYQKNFTSGGGAVEALYGALLSEEKAKGLTGRAAEASARKRLLAGDRPGNRFDDPTLPDNLPMRDRTKDPSVREVIDLLGLEDSSPDNVEVAPTDLSQITREDSPIEFADVDPSMIGVSPTPQGDEEITFADVDPSEIGVEPAASRFGLPSAGQVIDILEENDAVAQAEEPEPTAAEVDKAQKVETLLEARTLAQKAGKLRRLSETTEEGRTARDLVRANRELERPQPLEALRQKIAETYSTDPARQRRGITILYATDMAEKAARRQQVVPEGEPVLALEGE
jgi:hypothetical protein